MKTLPARSNQHPQAGFTLVELMVSIVVVAILMSIAIPSYTSQIRKSRRTEAKTALLALAAREERYFSTNSAYTNDAGRLGYDTASKTLFQYPIGSNYYNISACVGAGIPAACSGAQALNQTGATYLLQATPVSTGPQSKDTLCASFTVDNTGIQSSTGTQTTGCW
jgi:type IV pilus assembly protein PilE